MIKNGTRSTARAALGIVALGLVIGGGIASTRLRPTRSPTIPASELRTGELRVRMHDPDSQLAIAGNVTVRAGEREEPPRSYDVPGSGLPVRLPAGRYRVTGGKGPEWSLVAETVTVPIDGIAEVDLHPRHVVNDVTRVACDAAAHRTTEGGPPVSEDARLLAAAAAGIQLAVVKEPGDYAHALSRLGLVDKLYAAMAPSGIDLVTVNDCASLDRPEVLEKNLRDWFLLLDGGRHAVAAGGSGPTRAGTSWELCPRTVIDIGAWRQGYSGAPLDVAIALDALRRGRASVTSGPTIELAVRGNVLADPTTNAGADTVLDAEDAQLAYPGSTVRVSKRVRARLSVRAPAWIDATRFEIVAGGGIVFTGSIPPRATAETDDVGTLAEAVHRALRFDDEVVFDIPDEAGWVIAVVRGVRLAPDMPSAASPPVIAFTNPIWLTHR